MNFLIDIDPAVLLKTAPLSCKAVGIIHSRPDLFRIPRRHDHTLGIDRLRPLPALFLINDLV